MTATKVLKRDHNALERLFAEFRRTPVRAHRKRGELLTRIASELTRHARVEAEIFYPALGRVPGTAEGLAEARSDHDAVAMFLADALATDATDPALSDRVNELRELVVAHASEEEDELFPLAETLPQAELVRLGREMLARKDDLTGQLTSGATAA